MWRLIEKDYGKSGEGANLKPALLTLYSLAVAQGVLYGYRVIYTLGSRIGLAKESAMFYSLNQNIVLAYLDETVTECNKDPSFANGRNLVTYALDLMVKVKSRDSYLTGIIILGTLILEGENHQLILINQVLTGSESFIYTIQKILETLGPRSPYSAEIREHAARIIAHVARDIRLEEFPRGIECLSSLFDTHHWLPETGEVYMQLPKEYDRPWLLEKYERDGLQVSANITSPETASNLIDGHRKLLLQGLLIFWKLADYDDNCRVIGNTQGLLSKITKPLMSDILQLKHPEEWYIIAHESLELMGRLIDASGETGLKLRREILSNKEAVRTLKGIVECGGYGEDLRAQAIGILLDLSVDTSSILTNEHINMIFINALMDMFLFGSCRTNIRPYYTPQSTVDIAHNGLLQKNSKIFGRYHSLSTRWANKRTSNIMAGEKLLDLLSSNNGTMVAMLILKSAVPKWYLREAIEPDKPKSYRMRVAQILKLLCIHCSKDDVHLRHLKKIMVEFMPKVSR